MREKNIVSEDTIKDMFEELGDTSKLDQKHIQQMATKNEKMVELCQQLMETNQ